MAIKCVSRLEYYSYGSIAVTGVPEQPTSITIFIQTKEKDGKYFTAIPLVPSLFQKQGNWDRLYYSSLTLNELGRRENIDYWTRVDNIIRVATGMVLPFVNTIRNNSQDYSEEILQSLKKKNNVAGCAIDGKVVKTIGVDRIDYLIKDIANITNTTRLQLFCDIIKNSLKEMGEKLEKDKKELLPVKDVLSNALDQLANNIKANKRDISEIKCRIKKLEKRKDALTQKQVLELNELSNRITQLIEEKIKFFETEKAT